MMLRFGRTIYPFLIPTVGLVAGIVFYNDFGFKVLSTDELFLSLIAVLGVYLIFHLIKSVKEIIQLVRTINIFLLFGVLGLLVSRNTDIQNRPNWVGNYLKDAEYVQVRLLEEPLEKPKTLRMVVATEATKQGETWSLVRGKALIYLYSQGSNLNLNLGDRLIVPNQFTNIRNSGNPFGFKQADYLAHKQIFHQAFIHPEKVWVVKNQQVQALDLSKFRRRVLQTIRNNIKEKTTAGLVAAVLVNERSEMDPELWEDYSRTGIAHIVAISGMHINIFLGILLVVLYWIRSRRYRWIKYLICLPIVWLYILITGCPPSAVRAGVMFSVMCIAMMIGRNQVLINSLLLSAFVLLSIKPNWLYDVGFQLSFLSVLSIFIYYKPIHSLWNPKNGIIKWVWNIVALSISVQILLAPVIVYYFHQISLWSVVVNIPAALYSSLFMGLSLCMIAFDWVGINAQWLGEIIVFITETFNALVVRFSNWSPQVLHALYLNSIQLLICLLAIACLSIYAVLRKSHWMFGAGIAVLVFLGTLIYQSGQRISQQKLIVYQSYNKALIERVQGRKAQIWAKPSLNNQDWKYILRPAHIGWGVRTYQEMNMQPYLFEVASHKVLLLMNKYQEPKEVDIVVLNANAGMKEAEVKHLFNPHIVILDGSFTRAQSKRVKEKIESMGIDCHATVLEGAWKLEK